MEALICLWSDTSRPICDCFTTSFCCSSVVPPWMFTLLSSRHKYWTPLPFSLM